MRTLSPPGADDPLQAGRPAGVSSPHIRAVGACDGGSHAGRDEVLAAAAALAAELASTDRRARHEHRTLPTPAETAAVHHAFWRGLIATIAGAEPDLAAEEQHALAADVRTIVGPWLMRSTPWNRSLVKPHGFAGDYRMVELMYDLEQSAGPDLGAPAVVNLLDELFRSVHSVQAVWHRRGWFAALIEATLSELHRPVRVLDVACGGSRYVRDVIDRHGAGSVRAVFVDQDPAAIAHLAGWLATAGSADRSCLVCGPLGDLRTAIPPDRSPADRFDIVIATGVFDYLAPDAARDLLAQMAAVTRPRGTVATCNFAPTDPSRLVKSWLVDWQLTYRTEDELTELFAPRLRPQVSASPDGGLLYARARLPVEDPASPR